MSLLDEVTIFGKNVAASSATEFNVIDLGFGSRNIAGNRHGAGFLNVHVNTAQGATSNTLQLYGGSTATVADMSAIADVVVTLTNAAAGAQFSVKLPKSLPQFITVKCSAAGTGKIDAFIGVPLADH